MKIDPKTIKYWQRVWKGFSFLAVLVAGVLSILAALAGIIYATHALIHFLSKFVSPFIIGLSVLGGLVIILLIEYCHKLGEYLE